MIKFRNYGGRYANFPHVNWLNLIARNLTIQLITLKCLFRLIKAEQAHVDLDEILDLQVSTIFD